MLIEDLKYYKDHKNLKTKTYGLDDPKHCNLGKHWWKNYPVQDFDYQFNSWGFRGHEYDQYLGQKVNIVVGDSAVINMGGPIEYSFCSQLAENFDIPTLNLGVTGCGNDVMHLCYERACKLFDVQTVFVCYSYTNREMIDNTLISDVKDHEECVDFFYKHRIPNAIETTIPNWYLSDEEKSFFESLLIWNINFAAESQKEDFVNRDGFHFNQLTNKMYADYMYAQYLMKQK